MCHTDHWEREREVERGSRLTLSVPDAGCVLLQTLSSAGGEHLSGVAVAVVDQVAEYQLVQVGLPGPWTLADRELLNGEPYLLLDIL